jgi:hypothetical protein
VSRSFEYFAWCDYAGFYLYHIEPFYEELAEFIFDFSFEYSAIRAESDEAARAAIDFIRWPEKASSFG